ncbi:MAG: hypothetical protein JWM03_1030 [Rhodocyclales bacterium]|nr:hypothetical protein [Rhodocyclales bacterium]
MKKIGHGFVARQIRAHQRLAISVVVGVVGAYCIPHSIVGQLITRILLGWNICMWLYLLLVGVMMWRSDPNKMRWRARTQDEGKFLLLILVVLTAIGSLVAIGAELVVVKDMTGVARSTHIALVAFTIIGSWAFTHIMFALHYAHDYYASRRAGPDGCLIFPGTPEPDYGDFVYFSIVIGTSGQTADVSFASQRMRRVGTVHCVLSFFFNTTVLALTINIAASLL